MKIAVIGSGAAAHAVLGVIARQRPDAEVDVYDAPAQQSAAPSVTAPESYDALYSYNKTHHGLRFPPPKSHFGEVIDSRPEMQLTHTWQRPGGLTNFWGGTCLPFDDVINMVLAAGCTTDLRNPPDISCYTVQMRDEDGAGVFRQTGLNGLRRQVAIMSFNVGKHRAATGSKHHIDHIGDGIRRQDHFLPRCNQRFNRQVNAGSAHRR